LWLQREQDQACQRPRPAADVTNRQRQWNGCRDVSGRQLLVSSTLNTGDGSEIPESVWLPRLPNEIPDPTTRSLTVPDASTSPGSASEAREAAISNEVPLMPSFRISISPL
jgi:hypothetical protein